MREAGAKYVLRLCGSGMTSGIPNDRSEPDISPPWFVGVTDVMAGNDSLGYIAGPIQQEWRAREIYSDWHNRLDEITPEKIKPWPTEPI